MNDRAQRDYNIVEPEDDGDVARGRPPAKGVLIEWQVAGEGGEWPPDAPFTEAAPAPAYLWRRGWWGVATLALLVLLGVGGWLWHEANAGLHQIEGELQETIAADEWQSAPAANSEVQASAIISASALSQAPAPTGGLQTHLINLGADWAIVRVMLARGGIIYRQTRLYRRGAKGWYEDAPVAALWGAPATLETSHFVFHYYTLDSEAVAEAAMKLDALYPDLAASYPLDPASDGKRQIWVSPEYSLAGAINRSSGSALEIASPAIYLAPTTLGEGDILAQAVLLGLLKALSDQSIERQLPDLSHDYAATTRVYALLESLRLWQLWSTDLPLAALHKPTIEWLYEDVQGKHALPAFNAQLCSLHELWRAAPYAMQIPIFCGDARQVERYEAGRYLPFAPPHSLAEIHFFARTLPDEPYQQLILAERVQLTTVFDYAATTYGRQSLAKLIANAVSYSTWETLIPTSFGVPESVFETGWQAHLRNYYGVSASVIP